VTSELDPVASEFFAVCQEKSAAINGVLAALCDGTVKIDWKQPQAATPDLPETALLLHWQAAGRQAVLLLPAISAPSWINQPDEQQQNALQQAANDIAGLLHEGEEVTGAAALSGEAATRHAENALRDSAATFLPFELQGGEESAAGLLIFAAPAAGASSSAGKATAPAAEHAVATQLAAARQKAMAASRGGRLPVYTRSLLKICVPVSVSLATTTMPVQRILEIGEGSIIQFSKSCEETLTLHAGSQPIAEGEAVKVGDKFGLRISHMTTPQERFRALAADTPPSIQN